MSARARRVVLVTGGTKGIGLATALAFAREGAQAVLTCKWGSVDPADLAPRFTELGAPEPIVVEADVARGEDTAALFGLLKQRRLAVDVLISNAAPAVTVHTLDDYTGRGFLETLRASAWPLAEYTLAAKKHLGRFPRYVIAMSSDGPDRFMPGYDFVASAKAALETIARYLSYRLRSEGVRVNVIRSRAVKTDAFGETFGSEFDAFAARYAPEGWFMSAEEVANAAVALCSGLFDGMTGQVLTVDRGNTFADGISALYERAETLGL